MSDGFMEEALKEAYEGIRKGDGGPFGAVIVREGEIIGRGHNRVVSGKDPTLHGEMCAIKDACERLGSFDLSGCDIYTTGEPCPMCLGAILWAGIARVYYGCGREEAEKIGFRDSAFYDAIEGKRLPLEQVDAEACGRLFADYAAIKDKTSY